MLIYNHHDDWDLSEVYEIELEINNLPFEKKSLELRHYRIDQTHSNAYTEWVHQGKPMYPPPGQRQAIKSREGLELLEPPQTIESDQDRVTLNFKLPVHGISLLILDAG